MDHKKDYIIVKDRHPYISEVLWDCRSQLCVPAKKNEPLSSILQKLCSKINNNFAQLTNRITELAETGSLTFIEEGVNITLSGSGTENDPYIISADDQTIIGQALTRVNDTNITLTLGGSPATSLLAATSLTLGWTGQLSLARGGTGTALVDPNADRIYFWDDSAGTTAFLTLGTNLSIVGTTLNAAGGSTATPDTFNSTSSWSGPSGGFYSHAFVHNLGTNNYGMTIWDDTGTPVETEVDHIVQTNTNTVTIFVTDSPDLRFAGRIIINP